MSFQASKKTHSKSHPNAFLRECITSSAMNQSKQAYLIEKMRIATQVSDIRTMYIEMAHNSSGTLSSFSLFVLCTSVHHLHK